MGCGAWRSWQIELCQAQCAGLVVARSREVFGLPRLVPQLHHNQGTSLPLLCVVMADHDNEKDPGRAGPSETSTSGREAGDSTSQQPLVILIIGMAGSGKTTLMQRINMHLHQKGTPGYILNMDPAVSNVPYEPNIDIRDTVNYKNVMQQYGLGPNGGILTSLNLFATKFDQVIDLCFKPREQPLQHIVVDTPGQIEIFTWSASGAIITEAFASSAPTMVAYVIDTPRCLHPQTFMSNMLQACSIMFKSRLPLLLVFNKSDVAGSELCREWMADFQKFHAALDSDSTYAATLSRSLSMVLEEFYETLGSVSVSAVTGEGMDALFAAAGRCRQEYMSDYKPDLDRRRQERDKVEAERRAAEMAKLKLDQ